MKNVIVKFMHVALKKSNTSAFDVNRLCRKCDRIIVIGKIFPFPAYLNQVNLECNDLEKFLVYRLPYKTPTRNEYGIFFRIFMLNKTESFIC